MRRFTRLVVSSVIVAALVATSGCGRREAARALDGRPLAAAVIVSGDGCFLHVIDLGRGEEVVRERLRSNAYQVCADPHTRSFVTAQAGGVDIEADDSLGVFRAEGKGSLEYVRLPYPNPGNVAAVSGVAYAVCGVELDGHLLSAAVDLESRSVLTTGEAPLGFTRVKAADGRIIESYVDLAEGDSAGDDRQRLHRVGVVDPASLDHEVLVAASLAGGGAVSADPAVEGTATLLIAGDHEGSSDHLALSSEIRRIDACEGSVLESAPLAGFKTSVADVVAYDTGVAVLEQDNNSVGEGARLHVLDGTTFIERQVIPLGRGPVSIAAWSEGVVVADAGSGSLKYLRPGRKDPVYTVPIKKGGIAVSIAILDSSESDADTASDEEGRRSQGGDSVDGQGCFAWRRKLTVVGACAPAGSVDSVRAKEQPCRTTPAGSCSSRTRSRFETLCPPISSARATGSASRPTVRLRSRSSPPTASIWSYST